MHTILVTIMILLIVFVLWSLFRVIRAMIAVRRGPKWHMCPISTCGFAFKHTGEGEEDLDQTRDIMREHILDVHYISLDESPPEENDGKTL